MSKRSITKGKSFERLIARKIAFHTGRTAKRQLTEVREGNQGDIETTLPLVIQCKVGKRPPVKKAVQEAVDAAEGTGKYAIAVTRENATHSSSQPVDMVHMPLSDFLDLLHELCYSGVW